jgi:hypothetical protein
VVEVGDAPLSSEFVEHERELTGLGSGCFFDDAAGIDRGELVADGFEAGTCFVIERTPWDQRIVAAGALLRFHAAMLTVDVLSDAFVLGRQQRRPSSSALSLGLASAPHAWDANGEAEADGDKCEPDGSDWRRLGCRNGDGRVNEGKLSWHPGQSRSFLDR